MKTRAAICFEVGGKWDVREVDLAPPGPGEVQVKMAYAGLCHSDEHVRKGDFDAVEMGVTAPLPMIGGHEGAGVVEAVGAGVSSVAVGDHVAMSFIPSCGTCPSCSTGHQNLCDLGALLMAGGGQISDQTHRHHLDGNPVHTMCLIGTFSEHTVCSESSVIKIEPSVPMDAAALVSCGVATGWGSAVRTGEVGAGDAVVVVGVGGIGINAVQGAKHAGATTIVAVDPIEMKREKAQELGATHGAASMEEAVGVVGEATWQRMADVLVLSPGTVTGDLIAPALGLVKKGGKVVVTGIAPLTEMQADISLLDLAMSEKQLRGTVFGSCNPRHDVPMLLERYSRGELELDGLITRRYGLDDINAAYDDLHNGKNVRGVLEFV